MTDVYEEIEELNEELDNCSENAYPSVTDAWQCVALVLENHGVTVPDVGSNFEDEMIFKLEFDGSEDQWYLYFVVDPDDENTPTKYEVFACVINIDDFNLIDEALEKAE